MISYKLYAITDSSYLLSGETMTDAVVQAIKGGATVVQLREKTMPYDDLRRLALSVQKVCKACNVPFIINDDVKLAKEINADGVHLGADDMSIKEARHILGDNAIIGATAKTVEQAKAAEKAGADYIGSGAVFGSDTKNNATPMDLSLLEDICNAVSVPVVAIGGINADNVSALRRISIAGVAVVSGIFAKKNRTKACRDILCNLYSRPVIQCITNHVTVESVANMVLNFACSPIMSHNINEASEVQKNAAGLYINLGATDDYEAIKAAYRDALNNNHTIVIDPVGISGIAYRRNFLLKLLEEGSPTCIRGNVSEIYALHNKDDVSFGLESYDNLSEEEQLKKIVLKTADTFNTYIIASGETDIISDGKEIITIESGHPLQKQLTGSGCMLSAGICAALCISDVNYANIANKNMQVIANTCTEIGDAAKRAAEKTLKEEKGIYSFKTALFDELA